MSLTKVNYWGGLDHVTAPPLTRLYAFCANDTILNSWQKR